MSAHGFCLNLKKRPLRMRPEELILDRQEGISAQMVSTDDVTLPKRSEMMVAAQVEGNFDEGAVVVFVLRNEYLVNTRNLEQASYILRCGI